MDDPSVDWRIEGTYVLACNCAYGCPCNFQALPTDGWCEGVIGCVIDRGSFGGISLDGRNAFLAVKWPGAIHDGGGKAVLFIGETASASQRDALTKIFTGAAGGAPWAVLASTYEIDGPHFVPITATIAGKDTRIDIGQRIGIRFQPIRNPVTGVEAFPRVVLPQGMIYSEGEQYSLEELRVDAGLGLKFAHVNRCASLAKVRWPTT